MSIDTSFLEQALDQLEDVFFIFSPEGTILRWNQQAIELTGYSGEEIARMSATDFLPERERKRFDEELDVILQEGRSHFRVDIQTKEGRLLPCEIRGSLLEHENRQLICGIGRDISDHVESQAALHRSERKYRHLFKESRDGIVIHRYDGETEINPAGEELLGYSQEEFSRLDLRSIYVDPEQRRERLELLEEQGYVRDFETRLLKKDGAEVVCLMTSSLWYDRTGEVEGRLTIFRDITERKKAEEALRESEEKFRMLAEKSLIGIGLIQDGVYVYVNPAFGEIFGYSREEVIGQDVEVIVHPADRPKVRKNIRRRISGEVEAIRYSFRGKTRSGQTVYLEAHGARISYKSRPAIVGTLVDVTQERELQQEILQIQEAERSRIGQDLHDGVVSAVTGAAMVVRTLARRVHQGQTIDAGELERVADILGETGEETRRLARGLNPVQVGEHGLPAVLEMFAEDIRQQYSVECVFELEGSLPELDEEVATHLYRLVQEAVQNAVKHTDAHRIDIQLVTMPDAIELTVMDDGPGIPDEPERRKGMGIRNMRYRANLIGAALDIVRAPGGGTVVDLRLER